jgi:hypothetical protein
MKSAGQVEGLVKHVPRRRPVASAFHLQKDENVLYIKVSYAGGRVRPARPIIALYNPNYARNGMFYLNFTVPGGALAMVSRMSHSFTS